MSLEKRFRIFITGRKKEEQTYRLLKLLKKKSLPAFWNCKVVLLVCVKTLNKNNYCVDFHGPKWVIKASCPSYSTCHPCFTGLNIVCSAWSINKANELSPRVEIPFPIFSFITEKPGRPFIKSLNDSGKGSP